MEAGPCILPNLLTAYSHVLSPIWARNSIQIFSQTKPRKEQKNATTRIRFYEE